MTEETTKELHALCCRYDQWYRLTADEDSKLLDLYGDKFYQRAIDWG